MKIKCELCGHIHEGTIAKIGKPVKRGGEKQWLSFCPECNHFIPVKVPKGKIVMAFAYDESHDYFTDDFDPKNPLVSYYAFNSPKAFMDAWKEKVKKPDSMWYFVLNGDFCVCSGACDPGDIEIFEEYFAIQKKINRHKPKSSPNKLPPFVSDDGHGFYSKQEMLVYVAKRKEQESLAAVRAWLDSFAEIDMNSNVGFDWYGQWIVYPFTDETRRFEVNPIAYYGAENINTFIAKAKKAMPQTTT